MGCSCSLKNTENSNETTNSDGKEQIPKSEHNNNTKELTENDAYQYIIYYIISKGVASSCSILPNNLPKDNISIFDKAKAYSSSYAYGSFQGVTPNHPYYFWHLAIKVCKTGELGAINYGVQDWGIIQDGYTGEIFKEFSTFRLGVNTYMTRSLYELTGYII